MAEHTDLPVSEIHIPYNWSYADATARAAATGFVTADLYKLARQEDDNTLWMLTAVTPTWQQVGAGAASTSAAGSVQLATTAEAGTGTNGSKAVVPSGLFPAESTVASASTTNIGAATTDKVQITGTTTITAFDSVAAGIKRYGRFAGVLTLTHNGTSLILPGAANITTAADDRFMAYSLGSGNWIVLFYQKASGAAVVGSSGTKTLCRFTAADNQPPASNYATFATRNSIPLLEFDAATNQDAIFLGIVPEGASFSTGLKVRIFWTAATATSGDCVWEAAFERMNTDIDADSFASAQTTTTTTNGTSGVPNLTEITFNGSQIDGVVAGDMFRAKLTRNAAAGGDTMTGLAQVIAVEIQQL